MDLLAVDGHVIAPTMRLQLPNPPIIDFTRVGRNKATTFLGLCETHDREIFEPIDTQSIDVANPEHLFLLAYRAVHFEVHATAAAAWLIQLTYQKRVELGYDPKNDACPAGMLAVTKIAVAFDTYQYKVIFDEMYHTRQFGRLQHDVFVHQVDRPTLAASVLFSLDGLWNGNDVVRVCLNVVPLDPRHTAVIVSYIPEDSGLARADLSDLLNSQGTVQLYQISRRLINHSQNFVLAPDYFDSWPHEKRDTVLEYFRRTITYNDLGFEHQDLYLF